MFDKTMRKVSSLLSEKYVREWERFAEKVPPSDNVQEYLLRFPDAFHVPFARELFGDKQYDYVSNVAPIKPYEKGYNNYLYVYNYVNGNIIGDSRPEMKRYMITDYVRWINHGVRSRITETIIFYKYWCQLN